MKLKNLKPSIEKQVRDKTLPVDKTSFRVLGAPENLSKYWVSSEVVYMCFIFYSMQHIFAHPGWRNACIW